MGDGRDRCPVTRHLSPVTLDPRPDRVARGQEPGPAGRRADEPRFGMLETVREYGLELLGGHGEEEAVRRAHAGWCLALVEEGAAGLVGPPQTAWLDRLEVEHPNLRAGLGWLIEQGDATAATRLAADL